jgi:hypothetical protein
MLGRQADRDRKLEAARKQWKESPPAGRVTDETDYFLPTTRKLARPLNTSAFERSRPRGGRYA